MQIRFRLLMPVVISTVILFTSCGKKSNKEGRYIPKTAAAAFLVNSSSLSAKLPWEDIKQNALFKQMYADTSIQAYMKSALDNPENTGIDTKSNLLFFVEKDSLGGYIAFEGTIKDAAKFKQFNSNIVKAAESEKDGIHLLSDTKMAASWDKNKFVIVVDAPQMNNGTVSSSKRDLRAAALNVYALKEDESLAEDEKFTTLVGDKGDVHYWINVTALSTAPKGMAALSMVNLTRLTEGSFMTGVANFENGQITMDLRSYSGKDLTGINKKYSGTKLNTDMIRRIPVNDVAVLLALSFKPEGLRELIQLTGMEGVINMGVASLGFTFDDFIKANKGDILLSLLSVAKDSAGAPVLNGLFAASKEDKAAFGKLIEAGNKALGSKKMDGSLPPLAYNSNDEFFALGTDKLTVDKFLASKDNSKPVYLDKISGSSSVFYLNVKSLLSGFDNGKMRDSLDQVVFQTTLHMWDNVIATGGGFKEGSTRQHIEINLLDKNTNSLKQLNTYFGILGNIQKQKKEKMDKWMNDGADNDIQLDSLSVPVNDKY